MPVTVYTSDREFSEVIKGEAKYPYGFSREEVTIKSGENLPFAAVVGAITLSCPTSGTAGTNTGGGTCTGVAAGGKTKIGTYTLTCVVTATNGGTFKVVAPDGSALPDAAVGVAYTNQQINFTINDVDTDFAAGDSFTIPIVAGSGEIVEIDFDAVDGSQNAYGITYSAYNASAGAVKGVLYVRDTEVATEYLAWPDGATNDQKTAALAQLAEKRILKGEII